jgi:hypothetical protein
MFLYFDNLWMMDVYNALKDSNNANAVVDIEIGKTSISKIPIYLSINKVYDEELGNYTGFLAIKVDNKMELISEDFEFSEESISKISIYKCIKNDTKSIESMTNEKIEGFKIDGFNKRAMS